MRAHAAPMHAHADVFSSDEVMGYLEVDILEEVAKVGGSLRFRPKIPRSQIPCAAPEGVAPRRGGGAGGASSGAGQGHSAACRECSQLPAAGRRWRVGGPLKTIAWRSPCAPLCRPPCAPARSPGGRSTPRAPLVPQVQCWFKREFHRAGGMMMKAWAARRCCRRRRGVTSLGPGSWRRSQRTGSRVSQSQSPKP